MHIVDVGLSFLKTDNTNNPNKVIIHHSATLTGTVESFHRDHLSRGWNGIGYHYVIDKQGVVYRGREDFMVGAHCQGHNTGSLGICFIGDFSYEYPTVEQYQSGKMLLNYIEEKHGIRQCDIYPHNFFGGSDCPCKNFDMKQLLSGEVKQPIIKKEGEVMNWLKGVLIQKGSNGIEVAILQGLLCHYGIKVVIDGDCGMNTYNAIVYYQSVNGLTQDGICGNNTWTSLLK